MTSRSGGITSAISYYLGRAGIGQSTIIHVGGDAVVGTSHPDVVQMFEKDEETKAVVMFGEIGSTQEERVADLIERGRIYEAVDRLHRWCCSQIRNSILSCRRNH